MVQEYTLKIERIFYLKENQNLSNEQRNKMIQELLTDMKKESMRIGHKRAISICKETINELDDIGIYQFT